MNTIPHQNPNINDLKTTLTRTARWTHLLGAAALLLGVLGPNVQAAPVVTFATTNLNVTATATGTEILNDGTLVAANHFGGSGTLPPVTLANGLTFGTSTTHMTGGVPGTWGGGGQGTLVDTWGVAPLLNGTTEFGKLMRAYIWGSQASSSMAIPGLVVGHTYRLQLVSISPKGVYVAMEGGSNNTWTGDTPNGTPGMMTIIWTADDTIANALFTRNTTFSGNHDNEITINGYALHDITTAAPPAPTNLAATPSNAQVGLTWTAASGATGYKVKRSTTSGSGYVEVGTPTATVYTDTDPALVNGTTYYYVVTATNSTGESPNSGQVSATPTSVLSPAKDLLTFSFGALGSATISGTNITLTVPYGTTVTALAPTYTMSPFATCDKVNGGPTTYNFTNPVHYLVTAQDLTTKDYTVTVTVAAASSARDMLTFGPGATITGTNIAWSVPYGTSVTNLAPTFTLSPLATCNKASGSTQNFTNPVHYIVTAQDGTSTNDYTVTVTVALQGVTFTTTPLDVSSSATGAEILNTGTLIAANHVGNGGQIPITLTNGLAFGTSTAHLVTGWGHNAGDTGVATITNPAYSNLINCRWWVAYTDSRSDMVINDLVIGNTYRLQLISVEPNSGTVAVEGSPEYTWSGNNTLLTATWTAEDTSLNMQYSRKQQSSPGGQGGEVRFNGYALHDITQPGSLKNFTSFTFPTFGAATIASNSVTITVPWGTDVIGPRAHLHGFRQRGGCTGFRHRKEFHHRADLYRHRPEWIHQGLHRDGQHDSNQRGQGHPDLRFRSPWRGRGLA